MVLYSGSDLNLLKMSQHIFYDIKWNGRSQTYRYVLDVPLMYKK